VAENDALAVKLAGKLLSHMNEEMKNMFALKTRGDARVRPASAAVTSSRSILGLPQSSTRNACA